MWQATGSWPREKHIIPRQCKVFLLLQNAGTQIFHYNNIFKGGGQKTLTKAVSEVRSR
jgi:hypothetical protein